MSRVRRKKITDKPNTLRTPRVSYVPPQIPYAFPDLQSIFGGIRRKFGGYTGYLGSTSDIWGVFACLKKIPLTACLPPMSQAQVSSSNYLHHQLRTTDAHCALSLPLGGGVGEGGKAVACNSTLSASTSRGAHGMQRAHRAVHAALQGVLEGGRDRRR